MKTTELVNKKTNEVMKTKDGETLKEHRLEPGDEFIPQYNTVREKKNDTGEKVITNYSIKADVREPSGDVHKDVFLTLTETQANTIKNKAEDGIEANQNLWRAYEYESKEWGKQIGVGLKKEFKEAKTFDDFPVKETRENKEEGKGGQAAESKKVEDKKRKKKD